MMNPKISVIIPVYNVENYLEETLNNITNQTFFENTEVLLVDDGSTDNSGHIVDKYASDYDNIYAFHKVNEGQCVARNFALSHVKGEYIHFKSGDSIQLIDNINYMYLGGYSTDNGITWTGFSNKADEIIIPSVRATSLQLAIDFVYPSFQRVRVQMC